jgi:methylmalonyl-CoA epimerase
VFIEIDHVGIAVSDLAEATSHYRKKLGLPLVHEETLADHGVDIALLGIGQATVELMFPTSEDTPLGRFMAKRGPGLHHIAYRVSDISEEISQLKSRGIKMIDQVPRAGVQGSQVAFIHPESMGGVLTEIVEPHKEKT